MVRSALGRVAWVGRTASTVFGLALVMALVLGVASMAFGANGGNFILGSLNNTATALTRLTGNVNGAAVQVVNTNADANDTALNLSVQAGEAPMAVNSNKKVANLNADRLDDREASSFANGVGGKATDADKLDGMEPGQLPGTIASTVTIHDFPGIPFDLGTSAAGWKFVGDPATGIPTTSSERLVGAAAVPLGDPTATSITYDLCYRPSGGGTITPFTGGSSATLTPADVVYTATSSTAPGAGKWDVGFCVRSAVNDSRNAERVSWVNGWVMVVDE